MTIARTLSLAVAWLWWNAMVLGDGYYMFTAFQAERPTPVPVEMGWMFPTILLAVAVLIVGWTFLVRWLYKGVLIGRRLAPDSIASYILLPLIGGLIWTPCGAVAIYGLIVFFGNGSFVWFFTFMAISCALLIIHMPCFLDPQHRIDRESIFKTP